MDLRDLANAELRRLAEDAARRRHWRRFGPYLAERQWATVREDYSADGDAWRHFPHDHARSRAYRWGEEGLRGICDHRCRMAFALALWNERDPILKERLFGLTGPEGNHGEDVKELYFYLDSTPSHSYLRSLYKYPQAEFPYGRLVEGNRRAGKHEPELELESTGVFEGGRYFDVFAEYAKEAPNDLLIQITLANRAPEPARLHVLPTLWFRNTWSWGRTGEDHGPRPELCAAGEAGIRAAHAELGRFRLEIEPPRDAELLDLLFTGNETNSLRLFGTPNATPWVKDAFHRHLIERERGAVNPERHGTKGAAHVAAEIAAGGSVRLRLRLRAEGACDEPAFERFDGILAERREEAEAFFARLEPAALSDTERRVVRQGYAGLLHTRQFYHYVIQDWLEGDPAQPPPPETRRQGRNAEWQHLFNRDVVSMPDKWEYPWYAAWDLAFHMIPMARIDPDFAKGQLLLLLREWYMHPNGQIPAYEFAFSDVNPPVHAWAAWRTYKISAPGGGRDREFLRRVFHKLVMNFTWWVNRKDLEGRNLFSGGFLGLDNIGVFDRSRALPAGGHLEQADGTAWMAFYAGSLLAMALELAREDAAYEDMASKFFEHFVAIVDAINTLGGRGLWDDQDGFYYDQLHVDGQQIRLRTRSLVGIIPLIAVEVLDDGVIGKLPGFRKRMEWFLRNRGDLARHVSYCEAGAHGKRLLAVPSRERLLRMLDYLVDEKEFLSPYGIRSLSLAHGQHPYVFRLGAEEHRVGYEPGESTSGLFGGNSNWRGPIWFPINFLVIEALERYAYFYGDDLRVECPKGSGRMATLAEVAQEIASRLTGLFRSGASGMRPWHGDDPRWARDPHFRELTLFHEYFHGDTGRGLGASHQTGWTALAVSLIEDLARRRGGFG